MAIQEYTPLEQPQPAEVTIWPVEGFKPLHEHVGVKSTEFYASLGDMAIGLVHWETTDNDNYGYIDGIDPHSGVDESIISYEEWDAIAIAMQGMVKTLENRHISLIEFPGGSRGFLQAV